jgi:hypothetical protein
MAKVFIKKENGSIETSTVTTGTLVRTLFPIHAAKFFVGTKESQDTKVLGSDPVLHNRTYRAEYLQTPPAPRGADPVPAKPTVTITGAFGSQESTGNTVAEAVTNLGLSLNLIKVFHVNGNRVNSSTVVAEGDVIKVSKNDVAGA